jgi:hypothetical protein
MGIKLKQKHNGKSTGVQSASAPLNTRRKKDKKKGGSLSAPPIYMTLLDISQVSRYLIGYYFLPFLIGFKVITNKPSVVKEIRHRSFRPA